MKKNITLLAFLLYFISISNAQCNGNDGSACGSGASGSVIATLTPLSTNETFESNGWYRWPGAGTGTATVSSNNNYFQFTCPQANTTYEIMMDGYTDDEVTITEGTTNHRIERDADNNGDGERFYYRCPVAGTYRIRFSRHFTSGFLGFTQNNCGSYNGWAYIRIRVACTPGTVAYAYGSNSWNFYRFNNQSSAEADALGFYGTETSSFSRDWGTGVPACVCDANNFSVRGYMSYNFGAGGQYRIRQKSDDGQRLSDNNGASWNLVNNWGTSTTDNTTGILNYSGTVNFIYEERENAGGAAVSFNLLKIPNDPIGISASATSICNGSSVTLTAQGVDGNATGYWYSGSCGGTYLGAGNSITVTPGSTTTYFYRNRSYQDVGYSNTLENFSNNCASVTINLVSPGQPSVITSNPAQALQGANVTYSVTNVGGVTYTWSTPSGWNIISGQGTNSIVVSPGNTAGTLSVVPNNGLCDGAARTLSVCAIAGNTTDAGTGTWNLYYYNTKNFNFAAADYRGNDVGGSSNNNSAALNLLWTGTPSRPNQVCGTAINADFSVKALLQRNFDKGIYQFATGGDDNSQIRINGGAFFNSTATNTNTSSNRAMDGSTLLEYQNWDNGGNAETRVNITCLAVNAGILSSDQVCGSNSAVTLNWTGGTGFYTWESSTDGTNFSALIGENNTVASPTSSTNQNPGITTYYRLKVSSCGSTVYSNVITITRTSATPGNVTVAINVTMGGTYNISGDFTVNSGITITVPKGCPLVINATNIYMNGTINANGAGNAGGSGGNFGNGAGTDASSAATPGAGAGGGSTGTSGNNRERTCYITAFGVGVCGCIGCPSNEDGIADGGAGGGSGGGGSYGGVGGAGKSGGNGWNRYTGGSSNPTGGGGASATAATGTSSGYDIQLGNGGSGGGGGGGGANNGAAGGNGGTGGGAVSLIASNSLSVPGSITANGTIGGNGGNGAGGQESHNECTVNFGLGVCARTYDGSGGGGAGAGGGSGGGIYLQGFGPVTVTGTLSANGGNGGNGGAAGDGNAQSGNGGAAGSGGRIKIVSNPCQTNIIPLPNSVSINRNGGLGGTGLNTGNIGGDGSYANNIENPDYNALSALTVSSSQSDICKNTQPIDITSSTPSGALETGYSYQWYSSATTSVGQTGTGSGQASGWGAILGATGATLTSAQMGNLTTNTNYQLRLQSGSCYSWSNVVSKTLETTAPEISCPENIALNVDPGTCTGTASWTAPVGTDNCLGMSTAQVTSFVSGASTYPTGTPSTITYRVTDAVGLIAECSFTVTVTDNILPQITCPADIAVNVNPGTCTGTASWTAPVGTDNCTGASTTQVTSFVNGASTYPKGTTTITYRVTDALGSTSSCSFTVTVTDNIAPVITCPAPVTQRTDVDQPYATVTIVNATATDNCVGAVTITSNHPSNQFAIGTNTVIWTATDIAGNSSTCNQTVQVNDVQSPNIACGSAPLAVSNISGTCGADVTFYVAYAADNSGFVTLTYLDKDNTNVTVTVPVPPGPNTTQLTANFPVGQSTLNWTATDPTGNTALCTQLITVVDNESPVFGSCPSAMLASTDPNTCAAIVNYTEPVGTDNCPGVVTAMTQGFPDGGSFPLGATTVTYVTTDVKGNQAECSFVVTVQDLQIPVISCPGNIADNNSLGDCFKQIDYDTPVGSDNCLGSVTTMLTGLASGSNFPVGVTTVTYEVTGNSQSSSCSFTVTITDVEAPVALTESCHTGDYIFLNNDAGQCTSSATLAEPEFEDNCGLNLLSLTIDNPGPYTIGENFVKWTISDINGNFTECNQAIFVSDVEPPIITSCAPQSVSTDAGVCTATVSVTTPDATDNCINELGISFYNDFTLTDNASGTYPIGTTLVNWTVSDAFGNAEYCTQAITVTDNELPTITCNAPIAVNNDLGVCGAAVSYINNSTDNCAGQTIVQTAGLASGSTFPVGTTTNTFVVTDATLLNTATCSFDVVVTDNELPTITCNAAVAVNNDLGVCGAAISYDINTSDNCSGQTIAQTAGLASGSTFPVGTTTNTFVVTDATLLNTATCSFDVVVTDNENPTITCNAAVAVNNDLGVCGATVSYSNSSTDNCPGQTIAQTDGLESGSTFPIGTTTNSFTVTDASGNTATCSFDVVVTDNEHPLAICRDVSVYLDSDGNGNTSATAVDNGSSDACGISLSLDITTFVCASVSQVNTVVLTVTDPSNNVTTCSATVTVLDFIAPIAVCKNVTSELNAVGTSSITPESVNNGSTDACGIANLSLNLSSFNCDNVGPNPVILTVTDVNGNSRTCDAVVTVEDNIAPNQLCQNVSVYLDADGFGNTTPLAVGNLSGDNCGLLPQCAPSGPMVTCLSGLMLDIQNFDCNNIGANTVVLTVTDTHINQSTCSAIVTVIDDVAPIANCNNVTVLLDASGNGNITIAEVNNGSSDACGIDSLSLSKTTFNCGDVGFKTVALRVEDVNGNVNFCSSTITIQDNVAPVALCQNLSVALSASGSASITATQINNGSSDACTIATLVVTPSVFNCTNTGANTVTLIVTDVNGNSTTCSAVVTVTGGALYQYVILASEKVHLHNSNIQSGGVGVTTVKGKVDLHQNTTVTAAGTFVQSLDIHVGSGSVVNTQINSVAVAPIPSFETNPFTSNNDVTVASGQTVILNDDLYNKIKIEKYGTVIFTQPVVNIRHIDSKEYATIKFTQCTKIRLKEHLHMKKNTLFNPDGLAVTVFAQKHVDIQEGSKIFATIYAKDEHIKVKGKANNRTTMTGLFIAEKIEKAEYTDWNANTQCGRCSVNPGLAVKVIASADVNCDGATNGSATVVALGGTAPYSYTWNTVPVQTGPSATNLAPGTYTATATDATGATANINANIIVFNYTILASDEIKLSENDTVFTGSIGITNVNGKIDISKNSSVEDNNSIVIAPIISIDATSTVAEQVYGIASPVMALFEGNISYSSSSDLNVANNTTFTMTINDTLRRKITIGDNATLIVNAGILNITDKLEMKKNAKIRFTAACAKVRIKNDLTTYENPVINPDGAQVIFHINGNKIEFKKAANVTGTFYAPNAEFKTEKASEAAPNIMTGKFIVKKMNSEAYTYWYESTACPCSAGSGAPVFIQAPTGNNSVPTSSARMSGDVKVNAYPNPFKDNTTIAFTVSESTDNATLKVYNLQGIEIKQLYDGPAEKDLEYKFEFNADNSLESGIYYYRVVTKEGKSVVNKLMLLK